MATSEIPYCKSCERAVDPDEEETGFLKQDGFGDFNEPGCPYCGNKLEYYGLKPTKITKAKGLEAKLETFGLTFIENR